MPATRSSSDRTGRATAFLAVARFPELAPFVDAWKTLRDEALAARDAMIAMADWRAEAGEWSVLPLRVEEEDRDATIDDACRTGRARMPTAAALLDASIGIHALALSSVAAGGHIRPHEHENAFATAAICLHDGGDAWLVVDGERRRFRSGETLVFDYRRTHEVINDADDDRIVALILIDLPDGE